MFTAVPAVITTRSPGSTRPASRAAETERFQRSLTSSRLRDLERRHAPLERELAHRPAGVGQRDDRPARAQARHRGRRLPGDRRHEDRLRAQRLGEVAGRVRHGAADGRVLVRLRQLVAVVHARLDHARDPIHGRDRLDRVVADGRLAGEHQRGGAVEDRVRDVARLGARRLGLVHHRLEHLRRGDHRLPDLEAAEDDPLLQQRHERRADLDAEVAARDHDRVGLLEHVVEDVDRLRLLDLRDHVRVRARLLDQRAQVAHVRGRADEGERDEVDVDPERELEVARVLHRQRRDRDRDPRQVDALVRGDPPADDDGAARTAAGDLADPQPDEPVVDQDVVTGLEHVADHRRRDGQVAVGCELLGADRHLLPGLQRRPARRARRSAASAPGGRRSPRSDGRARPRPGGRARRAPRAPRACRARD